MHPVTTRPQFTTPGNSIGAESDVLVRVQGVSKKFCRNLRKSLWYGVQDIAAEISAWGRTGNVAGARDTRSDEFWAVNDVSFELRRGECLGLIGRNGAGKTTLLKLLNGLMKPDRGRIEIHGRIGALIALGAGFNPVLTGRENILVSASVLGFTKSEISRKFDEIVEFSELETFIDTPVQSYSSGMQVRLGFAVAIALEPDVLILDEVLSVGDAEFRAKSFNRVQTLLDGAAVIFVSHNMPQVSRICSRLILMEDGSVVADDRNPGSVIAAYHQRLSRTAEVRIRGSGTSEIHGVRVTDPSGRDLDVIRNGDPFSVLVDFSRRGRLSESTLQVLVVFRDEEGNGVAETRVSLESSKSPGDIRIGINFATAMFGSGRFSLSVAILSGGRGEVTCVVHNACSFVVEHEFQGYAPICLQPESVEVRR